MHEVKRNILDSVKRYPGSTPADIVTVSGMSRATVQKYLKELTDGGYVQRAGHPPHVRYTATGVSEAVQESFVYKRADGSLLFGVDGFDRWAANRLSGRTYGEKVSLYEDAVRVYESAKVDGLYFTLDAGLKVPEPVLDVLLCLNLYTMPVADEEKRTKMAVLLEVVKGSGSASKMKELIAGYLERAVTDIYRVIEREGIDAVAFIPPTATRPVQVMRLLRKEFEDRNIRRIPVLSIGRHFPDPHGSRQEQKQIRSVRRRIENAEATYRVRNPGERYGTVLLVDDLVGSGATMNEAAKQYKEKSIAERVCGLCLVGINTKNWL